MPPVSSVRSPVIRQPPPPRRTSPTAAPQARPSQRRNVDAFEPSRAKRSARASAIRGYSAQQLGYVREMARQSRAAGVPPELAVMTALVESRLKNVNYGDRDSIGLFQQRNAWGSRADRLNVSKTIHMFLHGGKQGQKGAADYKRLFGRLPPTAENLGRWAQKVQVSAFPRRYAQMYQEARRLLAAAGR